MSASYPLWRVRAEALSEVRARLRGAPFAAEVLEYLERRLADDERRAQAAPQNAQSYAARVEAGVRAAVLAVPAGDKPVEAWPGFTSQVIRRIERLGPATFGLRKVPDRKVVSRVIRQMDEERRREMVIATSRTASS